MVDKTKICAAVVVCLSLFIAGLILLASGCAVRHMPGGGTAPATNFEQVLAWNAAGMQANDGLASNVIALQEAGVFSVEKTKSILTKQAQIAQADTRITNLISAAALCAQKAAGDKATAAELNNAEVACSAIAGPALKQNIDLVMKMLTALTSEAVVGIKDPEKSAAITAILTNMSNLIGQVFQVLAKAGILPREPIAPIATPSPAAAVFFWFRMEGVYS